MTCSSRTYKTESENNATTRIVVNLPNKQMLVDNYRDTLLTQLVQPSIHS